MGIPSYFSYVLKNHKIIKKLSICGSKNINLFLDANSIIYDVIHENIELKDNSVIYNNVYDKNF